jgi:magnesium-transporting ATPase (P-type)
VLLTGASSCIAKARTVIYERLAANVDQGPREKTSEDMDFFANGGLRMLCIAYRVLPEDEFLQWVRSYEAAQSSVDNRDEAIETAAAQIEHSLQILGVTALEDKLQEEVCFTTSSLFRCLSSFSDVSLLLWSARFRLKFALAFDQDINAKAALAFPQLYVRRIRGLEYTRTKFWFYMLDGLYQSAVVFFIPYLVWHIGLAVSYNGKGIDSLADFGTTVAVAAIFSANTYVGMNTH